MSPPDTAFTRPGVHRRRGPAACAVAIALAGASGPLPALQTTDDVFEVVQLAEGVHAALVRDASPLYAFANSLVVTGSRGVLVVDTQQSPTAARTLIDWIRRHVALPVRWVVNTHAHADHTYGNEAYREAYPDVRIVAHESVGVYMRETAPARLTQDIAELTASIEDRRRWLAQGTRDDGTPLTDETRAALTRSLAIRTSYLPELRALRLTPPDVGFTQHLELDLGGRVVRLVALGPAHTRGDVIVHLPVDGIVAVGDLLEEGSLWTACADLAGWASALERIGRLAAGIVLPAHGGVHRGDSLLRAQLATLRSPAPAPTTPPDCRHAP